MKKKDLFSLPTFFQFPEVIITIYCIILIIFKKFFI